MAIDCEKILKALSDPKRQQIVRTLLAQPQRGTSLCQALNLKQPQVSKLLGALRAAGIVEFTQAGNSRTYRIAETIANAENGPGVIDFGCCRFRFNGDSPIVLKVPRREDAN